MLLVGTLSVWSVARPQTGVEMRRPGTTVEVQKPQTLSGAVRPGTTVEMNRPVTQTGAVRAQTTVQTLRLQTTAAPLYPSTTVQVIYPTTTVEVIHPQTTVEVIHPQTPALAAGQAEVAAGQSGGKNTALPSAQAATSMSNFTPKQAKNFAAMQKAAQIGGGENKLGNATNVAEKDAANKASLLGKQDQNIDVKMSNLGALGSSVEKKVEEKAKK